MTKPARALRGAAAMAALSLAACGSDIDTPFRLSLAPLESVDVGWPAGSPCPEVLEKTHGPADGYSYAHGRGCIQRSLAEVWEALQLPQVAHLSFWPERDESTCSAKLNFQVDGVTGYSVSFEHHETPKGIGSFADFYVVFVEGVTKRSAAGPEEVVVAYQKTSGHSYIPVLRGTVLLEEISTGVTGVELVRHLKTLHSGRDDGAQAELWIQGYFDALKMQVYGPPVPAVCALH